MFSPILKKAVIHTAPVMPSPFTVAQSPLVVGVASEPGYGEKRNTNSYRLFELYTPTPDGAVEAVIPVAIVANVVKRNTPTSETSQLAVETIHAALRHQRNQAIQPRLVEALHQVKQTIAQEAATEQPPVNTDAATDASIVVAAVLSNTVYLACIGKGCAYLINDGIIQPLLTPARPAADLYLPTAFPAPRSHPTLLPPSAPPRSGVQHTDQPRTYQVTLQAGDAILLCTPGLRRALDERAIYAAVVNQHPQTAAWQLAIQAHQAKVAASYTALIIQSTPTPTTPRRAGHRWRTLYRSVLAVCCLLLVIGQLFAFARWGNAPSNGGNQTQSAPLVTAIPQANPAGLALATVTPPAPRALPLPSTAQGAVAAAAPAAAAVATKAMPPAMVVARLWTRLALTTTMNTFTQNFATTLQTAGNALAAARTATASAPLPTPAATATPTPTVLPTVPPTILPPTPLPTRTRTIRRQPTPTRTLAVVQPAPNNFTNASVKLLEPAEYDTLNDKRPFRWQANFVLPPGYAFELVFWQQGQDPIKHGKGYAGLTTSTQINASYEHFRIRNGTEGEYRWGVLLVNQEPYQRIKYLGGGRLIYVKQK